MRCDIHTNRSITKEGKCGRIFCVEEGDPGCALTKRRDKTLERLKVVTAERAELVKELVV